MKRTMGLLLLAIAGSLCARTLDVPDKVELVNEAVTPEKKMTEILQDSFKGPKPAACWRPVVSFNQMLKFDYGETAGGVKGFVISNISGKRGDTAWELCSKPVGLPAGAEEWELTIFAASNLPLHSADGHGRRYTDSLTWFDASGREIGRTFYKYGYYSPDQFEAPRPQKNVSRGKIPVGATSVVLSLGMDQPDIPPDRCIVLTGITLKVLIHGINFCKDASFVSCPLPYSPGNLSWQAEVPKECSLGFQIAVAPDVNGLPGAWSEFSGPDGKPDSQYRKSGLPLPKVSGKAWIRYRVFFQTDGVRAPVLRAVELGDSMDSGWKALNDMFAPFTEIVSVTPTENASAPLKIQITDDTPVKWDTLKVTLDKQDITSCLIRCKDILTYTPSAPFAKGIHSCRIEIQDMKGNQTAMDRYFFIGSTPKKGIVTLRDDGAVLIDGKPFFPIVMFSVHKCEFNHNDMDLAMKELRSAGFNVAHTYRTGYDTEHRQLMTAASKYGMKTIFSGPPDCNTKDMPRYLSTVVRDRTEEAVLAWYLGDDTRMFCSPEELSARCAAVRAIDPIHLMVQCDGTGTRDNPFYKPYVGCTDAFMPCMYTVEGAKSSPCAVARVIEYVRLTFDNIREAGSPVRSVWPVLQYFQGWGWERFPTFTELRAMSWAAIIQGANGIGWYTYAHWKHHGASATPETWKNMTTVSKEIASLSDVLLERAVPQPVKPEILSGPAKDSLGNDSITFLMKKHGGKTYLFTVNSAFQPVTAKFSLPGLKRAGVLSENRSVSLENGTFTDQFSPFAVHLYELE